MNHIKRQIFFNTDFFSYSLIGIFILSAVSFFQYNSMKVKNIQIQNLKVMSNDFGLSEIYQQNLFIDKIMIALPLVLAIFIIAVNIVRWKKLNNL